jgi:hypothetical protein
MSDFVNACNARNFQLLPLKIDTADVDWQEKIISKRKDHLKKKSPIPRSTLLLA